MSHYVPKLQIRLMAFLIEAISRNAYKIGLTILLCLVVLYNFATIAYLAFPNQYGFDGQHDCNTLVSCFKLHVDYGLSNSPVWDGSGAIAPGAPEVFKGNPEVRRPVTIHSHHPSCQRRFLM